MWAAQFYRNDACYNWLSSGGAGTMGFGFPAAIGAQFARPDDIVVSISGDGGFQMTLCEIATAVIHKLPIKILVLNNHYLGMVRQWQELFFDERESGVDLEGNPDFVKLAESYGAKAVHIKRPADIRRKLQEALDYQDGPCLIHAECIKKENVFPMIPAGAALEAMITEAPKQKMEKARRLDLSRASALPATNQLLLFLPSHVPHHHHHRQRARRAAGYRQRAHTQCLRKQPAGCLDADCAGLRQTSLQHRLPRRLARQKPKVLTDGPSGSAATRRGSARSSCR